MKKRSNGESTRRKLLEESAELFAVNGFNGVTMRDISRKVGVTLPSIYHHFGSKDDLYRAVESKAYGEVRDKMLSSGGAEDDPLEKLRRTIGFFYDTARTNQVFKTIMVRNLLYSNEENRIFLTETALQPIYDYLSGLLVELKVKNPGVITLTMLATVVGFVTMKSSMQYIKGYEYAKKGVKTERDLCLEAVMKMLG